MQVSINLTPVLVALIICVFLYAMCKMARQDDKKKEQQEQGTAHAAKVAKFEEHNRSTQEGESKK